MLNNNAMMRKEIARLLKWSILTLFVFLICDLSKSKSGTESLSTKRFKNSRVLDLAVDSTKGS